MALTLKQMRERIEAGNSVLFQGRIITDVDKLPTAAQLAKTDEEKTAAADDLKAQMQKMQQQLDALETANTSESGTGDSDDTLEDLMKHTRAQLVEKAGEVGVEVGESDTKAEISQKILDANKAE